MRFFSNKKDANSIFSRITIDQVAGNLEMRKTGITTSESIDGTDLYSMKQCDL